MAYVCGLLPLMKPRGALPGYFGIRSEMDPRFKNFLNWWAEWDNKLAHNERRMKEGDAEIQRYFRDS